jgi:hypothetical protein
MSNILYKKFTAADLSPLAPTKNKSGGQQIPLTYHSMNNFTLQTPVVSMPFGISEYTPDVGPIKHSLELSFKGFETDSKINAFKTLIENLDAHFIELAVKNSPEWFGKKMSTEVVTELYRPILKPSKQPDKYAPTMKLKLRSRNDVLDVKATTMDGEAFDISTIAPGTTGAAIVDFAPIWFVNKQFGVTMTLLAMSVHTSPNYNREYVFENDVLSDDE